MPLIAISINVNPARRIRYVDASPRASVYSHLARLALSSTGAGKLGDGTFGVLELNRRMMNLEPLAQHRVDPAQDRLARRGRHVLDQRVTAQRVRFRA